MSAPEHVRLSASSTWPCGQKQAPPSGDARHWNAQPIVEHKLFAEIEWHNNSITTTNESERIINTYNRALLRRRCRRSPSRRRRASSAPRTLARRKPILSDRGTCCPGNRSPCSCARPIGPRSPSSRRSATGSGCTGRCRTGTGRCGKPENLIAKEQLKQCHFSSKKKKPWLFFTKQLNARFAATSV